MPVRKEVAEQRKHERFDVKPGAFVVIESKLGRIIDVSKEGLAFVYSPAEGRMPTGIPELNLFFSDSSLYFRNFPFKVVSDSAIVSESPCRPRMRRCGVQFEELSAIQQYNLDYFILKRAATKLVPH